LLHWCNGAHDINTDVAGRFLNLDIQVIKQMWDNMNFAVQNDHIYDREKQNHALAFCPILRYEPPKLGFSKKIKTIKNTFFPHRRKAQPPELAVQRYA
jgi:hypothetical protein